MNLHDAQVALLERRLADDPAQFREMFIDEGIAAVAGEFSGKSLSESFTLAFWEALLRDDAASQVLMRFVWSLPLSKKRVFVRALDAHLGQQYPMFAGLSQLWPAGNAIPAYVRPPESRSADFDLVDQGYLGYLNEGYSRREVELFVWLEALRDMQCADKPCELGIYLAEGAPDEPGCAPREVKVGGCPVEIHIPDVIALIGQGRFEDALELIESCNPLPDVTGRVCPQELQCQGVCKRTQRPIAIGQLERFLPQRDKLAHPDRNEIRFAGRADPWVAASRPPVAIIGSGPSGLINAYLLASQGFPVTVFEAFHRLGGVLRYGIPEFRLPNELVDDVVTKIRLLGGKFVENFVVGKTATIDDLKATGFWRVFVGTGAGLPRFLNVPGEHYINVMSANEFLTRVNLMQGAREDYDTPLPATEGKQVLVIGGGNTAMDAARTARRLGGEVTIVYRRTREEMPARAEELEHAQEEGVVVAELRSPVEFLGDDGSGFVKAAVVEVMELGEPDASGRRRPVGSGQTLTIPADLVIMALGNSANPIVKDAEPDLAVSSRGTIEVAQQGSQATSIDGVYSGGDAARGGSTAINAAGDGQSAAAEMARDADGLNPAAVADMVARAEEYTRVAAARPRITGKRKRTDAIMEFTVYAPVVAHAARAGQFVRVLPRPDGELIPLTLADWDVTAGTVCLVVQGVGTSSLEINAMSPGDELAGIAGPLGRPSEIHHYPAGQRVVFVAGGLGLPPVYPIMREHLRAGNAVTLISGFRSKDLLFWTEDDGRVESLRREVPDLLEVVYSTDDGSFGVPGRVTVPLLAMLEAAQAGTGPVVAEVIAIGPPIMMRVVADLVRPFRVPTVASLNSIMVDATGMCGACMVPVTIDGKRIRKHACIDGPEIDAHIIDWDKFLPRFRQFKDQEAANRARHGL